MQWLNGLKITPERLMDNTADEVITSGLSVPSGWSVSSFQGTRVHGITEVDIFVTRTGADITESSAGSGNISGDPLLCTLPSGWAPPRAVNATWGNGSTDGEATIVTSGEVNLRSISGSGQIATGTNVRVTSMWISETPGGYSHDETTDITTYTEAGLFWVTGAAGDGVSDDLWAIQAQLDAARDAGGGTVIIPGGKTYGVSTFLVVYDNTTIWAYGATIKAIGNSGLLRNFVSSETFAAYSGHSHIQILGGTWDGNAADAGVGTVTGTTNVMGFIHCEDITVRDATITNVSSAHGLEFNSTSQGRAINCRFMGYKDNSGDGSRDFSEAIQIDMAVSGSAAIGDFDQTPSKDILIQGCYVGPSSRLGSFGRGFGSHMLRSGVYYYGVRIIGCRIEGTRQQGVYGFGWRRAVIADNVVNGSGLSGIQLSRPDPSGPGPSEGFTVNGRNISITGNTVEGAADASGIRVFGASGGTYDQVVIAGNSVLGFSTDASNGIHVEYCSRPNVTGNTISGTQSTGVVCFNSDGATIGSNTIRNVGSNGVNVTDCAGAQVVGNTVDTTSTNHGVFISNSTGVTVQSNRINAAASNGIRLSTSATGCFVAGNQVRKGSGTTTAGISLDASATGAVLLNNDLTGNNWAASTALSVSTAAPVTGPGSMTGLPGSNLTDLDLSPLPALESAMRPSGRYETTSRLRLGTASTPTSGSLYLVPIWLPKGLVVSNIGFVSGSTAAATPTNWWFTLHNSSRVALARTADQLTAAWAANTVKSLAIAQTTAGAGTSYTTTYAGLHYLGVMIKATTVCNLISEGSMPDVVAQVSPGFGGTDAGMSTPPTVSGAGFTAGPFGTGSGILAYGYVS